MIKKKLIKNINKIYNRIGNYLRTLSPLFSIFFIIQNYFSFLDKEEIYTTTGILFFITTVVYFGFCSYLYFLWRLKQK